MKNLNEQIIESLLDDDDVDAGLDKALRDASIKDLMIKYPVYKPGCDMTGRQISIGDFVIYIPTAAVGRQLCFGIITKISLKRVTILTDFPEDKIKNDHSYTWNNYKYLKNDKKVSCTVEPERTFIIRDPEEFKKLIK